MLTLADVRAAAERIRPYVVRTPLERSVALSEQCGTDVWLKFECFQATGSFKLRGALNALLLRQSPNAVITASAGNHGLGVARAAAQLGVGATVVVPKTAAPVKIERLRDSGVELVLAGETYDDAEAAAQRLAADRGLEYVSPYNDARVIAGAGTIALEILDELPRANTCVVPVGGGGLISGVGLTTHALNRDTVVFGVQSAASPSMHAAFEHGGFVSVAVLPSLADGLAGNIEAGSITVELARRYVRDMVLVTEADIADAMRWLARHEHVIVEGSAAVGVAALLTRRIVPHGPTVVILTGRNVTLGEESPFSSLLTTRVAEP